MSGQRYTPEFKDEAVRQRGYSIQEVAERLGVSQHSIYQWVNANKPNTDAYKDQQLVEANNFILIFDHQFLVQENLDRD